MEDELLSDEEIETHTPRRPELAIRVTFRHDASVDLVESYELQIDDELFRVDVAGGAVVVERGAARAAGTSPSASMKRSGFRLDSCDG